MTNRPIIIDSSTLIYYSSIQHTYQIWNLLRSLFPHILIPIEIKNEFARGAIKEPHRNVLLEKIRPDRGFFRLCTKYDSIAKAFLETAKGIDRGEAEAIAQQKSVSSSFFLSDDKRFHSAVKSMDKTARVISSLHVLALVDIQRLDPVPNHFIKELYSVWKFSSAEFREAYTQVADWYSLSLSKKEISKKTSLKGILSS